ncbi:hypothetical protein EPA93_27300 [Ktedonosporobacter rubrisoli]|uniref:Blue (type 1) copper domain-containing protein n=1 Tax=Ktedonosporobacter rubrisoli TaxID=2509675 RepID=A0A4P6JVM2_KTERU|nr:plastocyanin/azurin family copper-binding protein [Ktedonosporobacter rubrisoli]QBD79485.1 hypothetical protein EPA93_27300 [Ktedonosporobacter rubrisoli]
MKHILQTLLALSLLTLLIVACSREGAVSTPSRSNSAKANTSALGQQPTVHMDADRFLQQTIAIKKGESITLIDDVSTLHVIANGSWKDGLPKYGQEPGAPNIEVKLSGQGSHQIGPFSTAGTFHLYCTVHQGMGLTVIVH